MMMPHWLRLIALAVFGIGLVGVAGAATVAATPEAVEAALQAGDFAQARALCQQAMAAEPNNPLHRYNFACIEATIARKETDLALAALEQAVMLGFAKPEVMRSDPELAALRSDPRFARLLVAAGRNAAQVREPPRPAAAATSPVPGPAAQPAAAGYQQGRPVGLYFMTRYWSYTGTLEKAAWYFAPDGAVYENLTRGFSPADLAAHTGRKGRSSLAAGKLTVTWADGSPSVSEIERDATGFMWDMGNFTPVQPMPGAAAVAGVYEGGESLAHGGNRVGVAKRLELRTDGTYRWEGVAFASGGDLAARDTGASTGNWRAESYALTLTDRTGRVFRAIAFPYDLDDTGGPTSHLFFAGIMYKRL